MSNVYSVLQKEVYVCTEEYEQQPYFYHDEMKNCLFVYYKLASAAVIPANHVICAFANYACKKSVTKF